MKSNEQAEELIYRFLIADLTDTEIPEFQDWLNEKAEHRQLLEKIRRELKIKEEGKIFYKLEDEAAWQNFRHRLSQPQVVTNKPFILRILRYAAIILLPLSVAFAGWLLYHQERTLSLPEKVVQDITPGDNQAILILSSGTQKLLGGQQREEEEITEGIRIIHNHETLKYDSIPLFGLKQTEIIYNTLKIPRGGEFQLVLSDGTKVWMNAESQLRYPVSFSGTERKVFLSGEAYFEVRQDSCRPFYVVTDEVYIRVYGTAFNVNTNRLADIQTVLVKGSIGVGKTGLKEEIILKPGELADFDRNKQTFRVEKVDTSRYTIWREGYFAFENESLEEIMGMLGRWYNTEVFFSSESLKQLKFTGYLRKYDDIKQILDAIRDVVEVQYTIKQRTIVISR